MEVLFVIKVTLNILDACQLIIKYKNKICYIGYKWEFLKKLITICIKMALNVMLLYLKFDEDFGCL